MRNRLILIAGLLFALAPSAVQAQTPCSQNCTVEAGKTFTAAWDQLDQANLAGFRIYVDGGVVGGNIPPQGGTVQTTLSVNQGAHTIQVASFNAVGAENRSNLINLSAVPGLPGAPSNFRLIITVTNGVGVFQVQEVKKEDQ